jgi:flagellar hook-length control protein FliK
LITGMGNLGPPLKATPDLKSNPQRATRKDQGDSRSDSFEETLGGKLSKETNQDKLPSELREVRPPDRAVKSETRESQMENKIGRTKNSDDETPPTDTVKAKSQGEQKGLSERQRVMQKFMDSMESEFGIPPQRIVEAMAQLSDPELLKSPEESAEAVIDKLDLEPQDSARAEAMYLAMLGTLGGTLPQVRDPEPLTTTQKAMLGAGGLMVGAEAPKLLSSRERRDALNRSLDQMNTKFFMTPPNPTTGLGSGGSESLNADSALAGAKEMGAKIGSNSDVFSQKAQALANYQRSDFTKDIPASPVAPPPGGVVDPRLAGITEQMQPMTEDEANVELLKGLAALGAAAGALSQAVKQDPQTAAALKMEQAMNAAGENSSGLIGANIQAQLQARGLSGSAGGDQEGAGENGKDFNRGSESGLKGLASASDGASFFIDPGLAEASKAVSGRAELGQHVGAQATAAGAAGGAAMMANKSENQVNIQQIMNQAQYMIKKGGGEAVVKMNPEGMGQVHLRVLVSEGKVNVEMKAETQEAKKLLESSLSDLKTSMNIHKLAVDHVKVDVNSNLAGDNLEQQRQQHQQHQPDLGREQARQFLGQFREENLSHRDGFYETTGIKAYGSSQRSVDPLKPQDEAKSAAIRRYQGSGKGSGLDLVA